MQNYIPTTRQLFAGFVAMAAVVAANLLAAEAKIPSAPEAVTGISVPGITDASFDNLDLVVPVMRRGDLVLPELPGIDVEAVREEASAWLGEGPIAAPTGKIEVAAPTASVNAESLELQLDVPTLERPEPPASPKVR